MATRKVNGDGVAGHGRTFDPRLVLGQSEAVAASAANIAEIADQVSDGATSQLKSVDEALAGVSGMAASLTTTAGQAEAVAASTEELVSGINEMAASVDQVSAN